MLTAPHLEKRTRIAHGFFTREGGVSAGIYTSLNCGPGSQDAREAVIENRRTALATLAPASAATLVTLHQIHSAEAICVSEPWAVGEAPKADAMATRTPGLALGILTADCAPVLLADDEAGVVGAAHAGWRGAQSGVIEAVVAAMESLGAGRARLAACVGPCIGQKNYEVSDEFRAAFLASEPASTRFFATGVRRTHWQFDLESFVVERLQRARVGEIANLGACTYADENRFFSFRRATHKGERDYGRQLSAILLT